MGGFDLSKWEPDQPNMTAYEQWSRVAIAVVSGTMPPGQRLPKETIKAFSEWYDLGVPRTKADLSSKRMVISCDEEVIPSSSIKRLSNIQLYETLLNNYAYDAFYKHMNERFSFVYALLPEDYGLDSGMGNAYELVSETHVSAQLIFAKHFGTQMASIDNTPSGNRWSRIYPKCLTPTSNPNDACITEFIKKDGAKMLKHELTPEEVARYLALFKSGKDTRDKIALVWSALAMSPYFTYNIDDRGKFDENDPELVERTLEERAVQLAYFLTGRGPDEALAQKARNGSLADEDVFRSEFERLIKTGFSANLVAEHYSDPITHWDRFFQEWLDLVDTPPYDNVGSHYQENSGIKYYESHGKNPINSDIRWLREMSNNIIRNGGRFESYFNAPLTSLPNFDWSGQGPLYLASIYFGKGSEPWDVSNRRGLLRHIAPSVYNQNNDYVNPIFRGIWVREHLFCESPKDFPADLGTPSNTAIPQRDESNMHLTTRHLVEDITSPADCQACHSRWNGIGFVMDNMGSLGEVRDKENIFMIKKDKYVLANQLTINTTAEVDIDNQRVVVKGIDDLQAKIAKSRDAQRCYVTRLVLNHGIGRKERADDKCLVDFAHAEMQSPGNSIKDMMFNVLNSKYMRMKRVTQ